VKLLLDTNALVRWKVGRPLPPPIERVLTRRDTEIFISIVSGWEIVMKAALNLSAADFESGIEEMQATLLPVRFHHLDELARLPYYADHRDPFDRMLIAQALAEGLALVSSDMRFSVYKRLRVLWK
jgi:PIN domain nuclease of toxin-antitoxin system